SCAIRVWMSIPTRQNHGGISAILALTLGNIQAHSITSGGLQSSERYKKTQDPKHNCGKSDYGQQRFEEVPDPIEDGKPKHQQEDSPEDLARQRLHRNTYRCWREICIMADIACCVRS